MFPLLIFANLCQNRHVTCIAVLLLVLVTHPSSTKWS